MITHRAMANRFQGGESILELACRLSGPTGGIVPLGFDMWEHYVEHAIRTVLRRPGRRG